MEHTGHGPTQPLPCPAGFFGAGRGRRPRPLTGGGPEAVEPVANPKERAPDRRAPAPAPSPAAALRCPPDRSGEREPAAAERGPWPGTGQSGASGLPAALPAVGGPGQGGGTPPPGPDTDRVDSAAPFRAGGGERETGAVPGNVVMRAPRTRTPGPSGRSHRRTAPGAGSGPDQRDLSGALGALRAADGWELPRKTRTKRPWRGCTP